MSDRIELRRLAFFGFHGVLEEEARIGQRFFVSLSCELDLAPAGASDDLAKTVSYAELAAIALKQGTQRRFRLIEALAEAVAAEILACFPAIRAVSVRVEKPSAPIPFVLDGVAVEIRRERP